MSDKAISNASFNRNITNIGSKSVNSNRSLTDSTGSETEFNSSKIVNFASSVTGAINPDPSHRRVRPDWDVLSWNDGSSDEWDEEEEPQEPREPKNPSRIATGQIATGRTAMGRTAMVSSDTSSSMTIIELGDGVARVGTDSESDETELESRDDAVGRDNRKGKENKVETDSEAQRGDSATATATTASDYDVGFTDVSLDDDDGSERSDGAADGDDIEAQRGSGSSVSDEEEDEVAVATARNVSLGNIPNSAVRKLEIDLWQIAAQGVAGATSSLTTFSQKAIWEGVLTTTLLALGAPAAPLALAVPIIGNTFVGIIHGGGGAGANGIMSSALEIPTYKPSDNFWKRLAFNTAANDAPMFISFVGMYAIRGAAHSLISPAVMVQAISKAVTSSIAGALTGMISNTMKQIMSTYDIEFTKSDPVDLTNRKLEFVVEKFAETWDPRTPEIFCRQVIGKIMGAVVGGLITHYATGNPAEMGASSMSLYLSSWIAGMLAGEVAGHGLSKIKMS